MASVPTTHSVVAVWLARARIAVAAAIVWALLHYVGSLVLPHGLDRPIVLSASPWGPLGGLLIVITIWVGGALATLIVGGGQGARLPLMVIGWGLALWAFEGGSNRGTMQSWLALCHDKPGPPTAGPYLRLLVDYVYFLLAVGGVYLLPWLLARRGPSTGAPETLGVYCGWGLPSKQLSSGLTGMAVAIVVGGVLTFILTGRFVNEVLRGQVYFAVGVGFMGAAYASRRVTALRDLRWLWPAPFVVGILGLLVAAAKPDLLLGPGYNQLDIIPAWGLARPLPVEMVGVGLLALTWMLAEPEASHPTHV